MKLAQHENELETNAKVKSQDFGIGNVSKIIGILRNFLYQHKIGTPVQEYMCNARDAMRESGSTKRIIVTVPNSMNPVFKVRDFGPGITPHRMKTVFIQYGESTKEDTNSQTGGFGIGAKSAWAYTDSFTIISITGGVKRTYVAHTGVNNQGRLDMVSEDKTDEPTGLEINVAVKSGDIREFRDSIWRTCHFWTATEYPEFKGVIPQDVPERKPTVLIDSLELSNDLAGYLRLEANYNKDYCSVIIDGIPYKLSRGFIAGIPELKKLLRMIKCQAMIHVGNGILDIPATRESVSDTDLNKEVFNKIAQKLLVKLGDYVMKKFDDAKSYEAWVTTYGDMSRMLKVDEHAKRGDYFISEECIRSKTIFNKITMVEAGPSYARRNKGGFKRDPASAIELEQLNHIFYIDNPDEPMVTQNRRIKEHITKHNLKKCIIIKATEKFVMELPTIITLPPTTVVTTTTSGAVAAAKIDPVKRVTVTLEESQKAIETILKDFGGKALSTLPFTPIVREAREKRTKEKEEFTIHKYYYGKKHPLTTTLQGVNQQNNDYIYIDYNQFDKYKTEFGQMHSFIQSLGFTLCAMTTKAIKTVKGSSRFKHYESWKASYRPEVSLVNRYVLTKAKNVPAMTMLSKATEPINDLRVSTMVDLYKKIIKGPAIDKLPKYVEDLVSKEVTDFEKDDAELTKLLQECYPLVNMVQLGLGTIAANEAVFYMNAKV